jgi:hypothetical protein
MTASLASFGPARQSRGLAAFGCARYARSPDAGLNAISAIVEGARALGTHVMDRCNLTILHEPGQEDLGELLSTHEVEAWLTPDGKSVERDPRRLRPGVFPA